MERKPNSTPPPGIASFSVASCKRNHAFVFSLFPILHGAAAAATTAKLEHVRKNNVLHGGTDFSRQTPPAPSWSGKNFHTAAVLREKNGLGMVRFLRPPVLLLPDLLGWLRSDLTYRKHGALRPQKPLPLSSSSIP